MCWLIDIWLENTFSTLPQTVGHPVFNTSVLWRWCEKVGGKLECEGCRAFSSTCWVDFSPQCCSWPWVLTELRAVDLNSYFCFLLWVKEYDFLSLTGTMGGLFHQCWWSARESKSAVSILGNIIDSFFFLVVHIKFFTYQIMVQCCINSQELLAEEMWPVFSPRKIDVYKMPSVSLKRHYYMIETDYTVIVFLFAYQSIFFLFFWFAFQ